MAFWLMKSEPSEFSIDDLARVQSEPWDGVRNYQARNMLKNEMQVGDLAFFYHSNSQPSGIAGIMRISRAAFPDITAFDVNHIHYDAKSTVEQPRWFCVEVTFVRKLARLIPLAELKAMSELASLPLIQKGTRLSIMPMTEPQWQAILQRE